MSNLLLTVDRWADTGEETLGEFTLENLGARRILAQGYTMERPWLDNRPFVSCIPAGVYVLEPRRYHKGGYDALGVKDVPGRTHVLLHVANLASQLAGCIAPGRKVGDLGGDTAVLDSRRTFNHIMQQVRGAHALHLVIRGPGT